MRPQRLQDDDLHVRAPRPDPAAEVERVASLPILIMFLLLQRFVIRGFASGLKG